jgi:hypothetical protein
VSGVDVEKLINKEIDIKTPEDICVAANGAMFSKNKQGIMPQLVIKMYEERVKYKRTMLAQKQVLVDIETEMKKRGLK